ncbi:MAG TPA: D-amino-acid transaminase [Firmicutes bacterium]|nr:D-amino-acid transaminase [Bacillota bacterium]
MPDIAYLNGNFVDIDSPCIPVEDRGFQLGDGVYEVIRCYEGHPFAADAHLSRLFRSLKEILLDVPWDREALMDIMTQAVRKSGYRDAIIYLQVTRGAAPRVHAFPASPVPTLAMTVREAVPLPPEAFRDGVKVILEPDIRWLRCDIKSIDLLPNVLAKERARRAGAYECVLVRETGPLGGGLPGGGLVTEGASSNVFIVKQGVLLTAPASNLILSGITRGIVLELARQNGIPVIEAWFTRDDLLRADEIFLTGTTAEVLPVTRIGDTLVAGGKRGPVTEMLHRIFEQYRANNMCRKQGGGIPVKIGVLSDTHIPVRAKEIPREILEAFSGADLIIHAGDIVSFEVLEELARLAPVEAVSGNMDPPEIREKLPSSKTIEVAGKTIAIMHGHGSPEETVRTAETGFPGADCVVFGHTHRPYTGYKGKTLILNPGSCVDSPWTDRPSYAILYMDDGDPTSDMEARIFYLRD